ncbi:E3 ubiquitin-protein ligase sina-like 7 [Phtheirospermum japonicum]|uniref:E3 ubiquitin-protein ligase sina-like 7 n=1 Tax=Phtheirospermum japonicum TaxID=374723 RepID=A0A830B0S3_9LAMI|nr:E3 ubiquitin-protein ligase sina-like 7 [Phtheirospermum japonicum]
MKNKCASCSMPIGYNRCRAIEKVIESIRISCPNMQYGCTASLNYSKKLDHERICCYAPCSCPYPDCTYVGSPSSVYSHFAAKHKNSSKIFSYGNAFSVSLDSSQNHAFLQTRFLNTLFVLSRCIEPRGSFVNVVWIAPSSSETRFSYKVSATDGVSSIKLNTLAEATPQLAGQPSHKTCLFVPNDFVTSGGHLKLELTIRRDRVL